MNETTFKAAADSAFYKNIDPIQAPGISPEKNQGLRIMSSV